MVTSRVDTSFINEVEATDAVVEEDRVVLPRQRAPHSAGARRRMLAGAGMAPPLCRSCGSARIGDGRSWDWSVVTMLIEERGQPMARQEGMA